MPAEQNNIRVLVIDDDRSLRELLGQYLQQQGFDVRLAADAEEARALIINHTPFDVLVADVMMPGENGMDFTRWCRTQGHITPILMLTAMVEVENRIEGLECGADDYLTKPFEPRELCLRIEKLVQRSRGKQTSTRYIRFGDYVLDCQKMDLKRNDQLIALSTTEAALLVMFARSLNQPIPRDVLSQHFHGISERSIDVQITRLRKKIEHNVKEPVHLVTVRGEGYMLKD